MGQKHGGRRRDKIETAQAKMTSLQVWLAAGAVVVAVAMRAQSSSAT